MPTDLLTELLEPFLDPAVAAALVALLAALGALAYRAYRGEDLRFSDLPFDRKFDLARSLRAEYAERGEPNTLLYAGERLDEVTARLAECGYSPKWPFSWHYRGESENLVRYYYDADRELPHRQVHVRLFKNDAGEVELYAHEEPYGLIHADDHVDSHDMADVTAWVVDGLAEVRDHEGDENALDPRLWADEREHESLDE